MDITFIIELAVGAYFIIRGLLSVVKGKARLREKEMYTEESVRLYARYDGWMYIFAGIYLGFLAGICAGWFQCSVAVVIGSAAVLILASVAVIIAGKKVLVKRIVEE